jgi:uncharacterized protein (TIGR02246 family)
LSKVRGARRRREANIVEGNVMTDKALAGADRPVREVLAEVYAAWAANDADAFVEPYADTATAILPGCYLRGRQAIRATMAALFAGDLKGSMAVHEVQQIRFAGTEVAIVTSKGAVVPAGQAEPDAASRSLETWVLSRDGSSWRVQAFHNCPEQTN